MVIKILNQELEQLKKELWNIKNKVIPAIDPSSSSITQDDLDELAEELSSISSQLSSLSSDVSDNATDIASIQSDISSISSSISSISSDLSTLGTQVGTNSSSISSMQSSISYHNSCLQSIDSRVGTLSLSVTALSTTVSSLESTVSSHTSSISTLSSNVSSLQSDVSSLQTQTNALEQEVQTISSVSSGTIVTVSGNAQTTWNADTKADVSSLPTALSQLTDDSSHRFVSDTEKATWNGKSDFNGEYSSLVGKPVYVPIDATVTAITNDAVIDLSSYLPALLNVEVLFSFAGWGKDATNSQQSAALKSSLTQNPVYFGGGKTYTSAKGNYLVGSIVVPISSSSKQVTMLLENNRYNNTLYIHGYRRI